jgi:amino acid adenylation domain-containing protein
MMPDRSQSLVALLQSRALETPDRGYTWLARGEEAADRLTYAGLDARARTIAAALAGTVPPGERALLLHPPGLGFVAAFFGCLYAGVIAVPAYPPHSRRADPRLRSIATDCRPRAVLTTAALLARREALVDQAPELASALWLDTETLDGRTVGDRGFEPCPTDIAFLQYTSGSTGTPKGVVVTHANLLHNLERIRRAFGQTPESVVVGWLPLFHDMGLIGNVLEPCYVGCECVLMSPAAFLQKPLRWLEAIDRFRGTTSGGPNFAYDLCARSIGPEARAKLDLSSWSVAFNGAEPVRRDTLDLFAETFAPCGFRGASFAPCYGLAESTLLVTAARGVSDEPLVSCGPLPDSDEVRIVDGEIWVSGPCVAAGYWNRPEETRETFGAMFQDGGRPYLRTGDLGFVRNGELVVTGRLKDLIILRGRNLHPQDLELTAEQAHPALRAGGGAAFSVEQHGEESVVVVHEVERRAGSLSSSLGEIADAVRRAVAEEHGVRVADVVLLRAGTIPKTSSGKIRRRECRALYLAGDLEALHRSAAAPASAGRLLTRCDLLDLDPAERAAALMDWLREEIARRAGVPVEWIGPETVIAAAGLDSLALFDLQGRLEGDLGFALPAASLAELSIAELCDRLLDAEPGSDDVPPVIAGEVLGDHPASPGQEALWLLERSASTEGVLHIVAAARLGPEVDSAALLRAAHALSARHPALRTTFAESDGVLRQRVHASLPPDLAEETVTELDGALRREARRRLDLAEGPPLRIRIFVRPDGERVLLLVLHHLIGDFWSVAVLLRDWAALSAGRALPELAVSYTDFVRWQQRLLESPAGERLERYWLDRLRDAPLVLDLPTDRPRPRGAAHAGALAGLRLGPDLTGRVRELARAHGATLFTTLMAAFEALLGRLTGQLDILIGSPTSVRRDAAFDGVVGYFVNPIVLRADLAGDPPFAAHLAETRRTVAAALDHRDLPFPLLARRLQPVRDPGRPPVFQAMFVLQSAAPGQEPGLAGFAVGQAGSRIQVEGLALEALRLDPGTAQLDLTLSAAEAGDALVLSCEHDTALFDGVTVGRWLGHLETLLDAAAERPEARLGELPRLGAAERHQLLLEWSDTAVSPAREAACLHELFEAQARRTPRHVAVSCAGEVLTYAELDERSNQLAHALRDLGVGPDVRVGVCMERSIELMVALLGTLKAGGAYVPIDPESPRERILAMIEDARAAVLLTQESFLPQLPETAASVLVLNPGLRVLAGRRTDPPASVVLPAHSAYVLFTSGSTGRPKGVMIPHAAISHHMLWLQSMDPIGEADCVLQKTPIIFDASVWELFAPLLTGGRLAMALPGEHRDPGRLIERLQGERVTVLQVVPTLLRLLLEEPGFRSCTELRLLYCGGEALAEELKDRLLEALPATKLINLYGPTETTINASSRAFSAGERVPVSLGRPMQNGQLYVVDPAFDMTPIGIPGELLVGGAGLARGYLGRPDLTAERFMPDTLGAEPGGRLYRTGDLVRSLPSGELQYLGRIDHQVKIRGFRIEPGEVEASLLELPSIRDAVVVAREDGQGSNRLVAYLVTAEGEALKAGALRHHLRDRLPEHMVPAAFVTLAALPRTPSGKLDRKALPAPEHQRAEERSPAPRTPVEEVLAGIWAEVLDVEQVGVDDGFFALGGHSLLATRVMSRLRAAFGIEMPLHALFEAPALADFAARVEAALLQEDRAGVDCLAPPLVPVPREGPLPLSYAQQRLWFIDQLEPGSPLYNMPGALRAEGLLDSAVLALCLGEIVRRHEALRTVFAAQDGVPVQVIQPAAPFPLPLIDLSGLPEHARKEQARVLLAEEAVRPFDLARGPLLRAVLLRLAENDHVLALTLHHIVSDGWSMGILLRELAALYPAFAGGRPSPLPELPVQYADFAVWQRRTLVGASLDRRLTFWRAALDGAPLVLELPADRPRPPVQSFRGASSAVRLPPAAETGVRALARRASASPFMVLLAGFAALLGRLADQEDLLIGSPGDGRGRTELEGLIGFFINTLALRARPRAGAAFIDLVGEARGTVLNATAEQDMPFERLVEELSPERDPSRSPIFQAVLDVQTAALDPLELPGLALRPFAGDHRTAKTDLSLHLIDRTSGTGWEGHFEYSTDLFEEATIARWAGHLETLLTSAIADPSRRVAELALLTPGEREEIVAAWSRSVELEPAAPRTLAALFEASADRFAELPALSCGDLEITYSELEARANQLAHHLRAFGTGPEVAVGVCCDASPELVVAALGIAKAGGVYVPLDPQLPLERLSYIIEDAGLAILLTQEHLQETLPVLPVVVIAVDGAGWDPIALQPEARPVPVAGPDVLDHLAYVIYTSGSTGRPKGVGVPHRGLATLGSELARLAGIEPGNRVLLFASIGFDASASELVQAWAAGAALVLATRDERMPGPALARLLVERRVSVVTLPPSALAALPELPPGVPASLIVAGEACPPDLAARWRPGRRFVDAYGPTETTVCASALVYEGGRLTIGRPIAGFDLYVADRHGSIQPTGVPGELLLGGPALARGYHGRPDLTAERFVPHPFLDGAFDSPAGLRLYRTGDLARSVVTTRGGKESREFELLGRIDDQVKIRGFRIEPGEIEAALAAQTGVREAAVVAREDAPGDLRLVAYVVGDAEIDALRQSLRERLPDYMVPSAFVELAALPLSPNGKVDRKSLPAPEGQGGGEDHRAPRTPVEEILAGIWAEILGLERIGVDGHFFDLGGHSLLAMQMIWHLQDVFAVEVPQHVLFEAPVLADFAARIEEALRAGAGQLAPPLEPIAPMLRQGSLLLSFAQQRLWLIDQLEPGSPLYNVSAALRVQGPLHPEVLARCLGEVVRRHEALRTVFSMRDGEPVQVIQPPEPFFLPMVDLAGLPERLRETQALALTGEEAVRPFDLTRGPLLRSLLLRLAGNDHLFALTLHHIVSDGWSAGVLVREVAALYPAFAAGRPSPLPELPVQYADFAVWQRSWLRGEILENALSFWRRQLAGLPPRLELPTDRPRPPVQSFRGAARPVRLPADLTRRMYALSRSEGATLYMVLLAGFQALLARTSGQDDLAVGSPVAGRNRVEIEGLIGFFVNTLVLRGNVTGHPTFRELLARVRETSLAAHTHQDLPFEKLVEGLAPERSLAHAPLFQVMLVLQNAPFEDPEIRDLQMRRVSTGAVTSRFDLTLGLEEREGGLSGTVEYSTDLFDATTIDRLTAGFERLLAAGMATPEASALALPFLSEAESAQILTEWNDTRAAVPEGLRLHDLFAAPAAQRPDAVAAVFEETSLTYGALADRAAALAGRLRAAGAGPEALVGICLEEGLERIVAVLGVFLAGGAYLPLDPAHSRERIDYMIEDAGVRAVLTSEGMTVREDADAAFAGSPGSALDENLAYVIYTSGSTGLPNGVMIRHRSAVRLVFHALEAARLGPWSRVLQSASFSFDASVLEVWAALASGGTLYVASREARLSSLGDLARRAGITFALGAPSVLALLPPDLPALDTFLVGGESCPPELASRWAPPASGLRRLFNCYGPTETTIYTAAASLQGPWRREPPLGRPVPNTRAWVLDRQGLPLPAGIAGELAIAGDGLARGYLNRPSLTAERFVPDPFASEGDTPGSRLYRTGDLARWLPAGDLEFLGRVDHQVKIRGFRIEPGEIEAALARLPGVRDAVVMVREKSPGDRRLVAYVTGDATAGELRCALQETLPDYMVPAAFVQLPALPVTPHGKIDRKALPAPEWQSTGEGHVAPRTPVEEVLAGLWAELLGVERVGANDRFFDLGGHSLLATRVVSRVRSVFGIEMPLRDLFEAPRLADLAARIEETLRAGGPRHAPPLSAVPREGPLPLSFAQQRLWLVDQLDPGSPLYNIPAVLRIRGPLDPAGLARCLGEIVRRHEALRTVFAAPDGAPVQVIRPPEPFRLPVIDLAGLPDARLAHALAREEAGRPFDLARGPLVRGLLLRLAGDDHILVLTMHHIVSDGWSLGILVREVAALSAGSPLPELPVQPADFAVWQRSRLQGEALESEIAFWRGQLAGLPPHLALPTDRPRPPVQSFRGASRPVRLPADLVQRTAALGRREGATLFMALLAGFQALLARYTGQDDLAVGSPVAGRNRVEIEGLIGFFVNTLVLRGDLAGAPTFRELLGRVRETVLAAHAHQDVPFEKLVEELAPERSLAWSPLVQVMLALQNVPLGSLEIGQLRLQPLHLETATAKFDLTLSFAERGGELEGVAEYASDLFDAATVDRLTGHFAQLLAGLCDAPERPVEETGLATPAEARQLAGWNATERDCPRACIHELFAGQAERAPDAVAVVFSDSAMTYAELLRRSRGLARRLRRLGIRPGMLAGLCAERSPEMVAGMLGILAAGGAYVPLDPEYPEERLAFLLEDTGAGVVVAQEHLAGRLPARAGLRVEVLERAAEEPGDGPAEPGSPDLPAYVLYTSGSTGRPKGVVVPHRAVVRLVRGTDYVQLGPDDRVAQAASSSFDAATFEIWGPLLNGGRVVGIEREAALAPRDLVAALDREEVTTLFLTTALLNQVAREEPGGFARLRTLLFGGELVDPAAVLAVLRAGPPERLLHVYGPTETTTYASWHRVETVAPGATVPIGRPLANGTLEVLDRGLGLLPVGVPGELYIGGDGLAHGYHARPELTAERFVPHPQAGHPGTRLYRTGDLVRRRPDGSIEFLGRLDHQVKIRGFRVEPGEIEAALLALPGVREAVVVVRDEGGDRRLVAYATGDATAEALRHFLREQLPDYMVPAAFVVLDALPLNPNGKVDRKALPAPDRQGSAEVHLAPRTPVEEVLAGIWCEVLGLERVGITDRFFDLGGHSLLATRVLSRIREAFRVELPLRDLFEAPALSELAARIEAARIEEGRNGRGAAPPLVPLSRDIREILLPLSFAQERFWVLDQLEPGNPVYNMPGAFELAGPLDVAALTAALGQVAGRHEVLRTVFRVVEGAPRQHILPSIRIGLPVLDLAGLPDEIRRAEAKRLAAESSLHRFDLAGGPLLDAALLRLGPDRHHLLIVLHHAVCDGWSLPLLVREIGETYAVCGADRSTALDRLPVQYADFAVWQRELVAAAGQAEISWWQERLAGEIAPLDLPTDRPRPAVQTWRGGRRSLVLSPVFAARLAAFGRAHGATLFMTLLAAIKALLHRHSGQDDILVGAPVAGRRAVETENLIGCFLNTLVLRTSLGGAPSFRELAARVREVTLGAYSHQDVPFEAVLASLPQPRDLSRTPLFQVMVNLLNLPSAEMHLPGLAIESLTEAAPLSKFDMTFYVREEAGVHVELVYNADLFDAARMEDLLAQLDVFLAQALDRPDEPIAAFSLITLGARAVLPDPAAPLPPVWTGAVHERFAEWARQHPERPAVTDRDGVWSYGDLETAANGLSAWLQARGIMPGDRVAVYAHRSAPIVLALLGILKAGAAFTVLDPAYPATRLVAVLDATAPRAFLRLEAAGALPAAVEEWLCAAGCPALALPRGGAPVLEPGDLLRHTSGPDDLAWVSFTSGSTGVPKGVLGPHRPLSHFIAWHGERFGLTGADRFSLLSGLAHDPLLRDLFTPLCLGALLAIPEPEELASPLRFARWMREKGVTVAHLTPALSEVLTEAREVPLESLRFAFFGGDVLSRRAVERLRGMAPGCVCVNYYGATETPQGVGFHEASTPDRERIPVGRGIDGVQLLVLNAVDRLAGVGELGEICIRTPYLAHGYLGDEALTRERFVANPFTGAPDDRLYRTGDLGRYLPDGSVDLHGRRDTQVKIRGFRIELGEIEEALRRHPVVREAVAVAREGALVAYVILDRTDPTDPSDLRRALAGWLREQLPDYMLPGAFVALDALPLTPNGKVDRKALPAPEGPPLAGYQAPRTPVEEVLAGIWGEVLGLERVGIADRFFDLGGHSLLATQVLSRVRAAFGVELPLRDLFEAPALADLAARIEAARLTGAGSPAPPLVPVPREGELPLSFAQQRLWFFDQLEPESSLYNMQVALRIAGPLDAAVLARALEEIVRRHEVLRTVYAAPDGAPVQVIRPAARFVLPVVDLAGAEEEASRPFDLARGPVLRGTLVRLAEDDHVLALTLHHIAGDAWSLGLLVHELTSLYAAFVEGRPSPLAELPVQYADFAVWQGSWLQGEALEGKISYWRRQLAGLPPLLELPLDRPRPAVQSYRGASRPLRLPAEITARIRALGKGESATLFMVLLAGFQALLARYSGQQGLAVGSPVAGRNRVEVEGLIGLFVNMLVLRGDLSRDLSFRELLGRSRETALAAYLHQDVPFEMLVQELAPERSLSHSPLFQVALTLQNAPVPSLETGNLRVQPVSASRTTAKFDLEIILQEDEGGLAGVAEYAADLFDAVTIDRLIVHFEKLLTAALAAPEQGASGLPLLAPAEQWQALHEWNDTDRACPKDLCLQDLFAEQAARAPHAVAVSFEDRWLTYRALDEQSDRLAQWLIDRGAGMDVLVALLVERSLEMIVALVGILKAGGSYAPLEPGMPPSRLRWLLDDVRSPVLLSQRALLPEVEAAGGFEGSVLLLDGEPLEGPALQVPVPSHPLQLAYVNYTSGSTGKPKGVVVPHLGVTRLVMNPDYMELGPDDVILQLSTYAWDAATWEIWGALLNGGRLVMIPSETVLDFHRLARVLVEERMTALYLTTALFNQLVEQEGESLAGLSTLIIGGETASVPHFQKAVEILHHTRIINEYGPTENTSYSSWQLVRSTPEQGALPIGKPLSNSTVYVLDRQLQPMPLGLPGELFLGGDGLARGYLGRPDLTAERFVPHPFAAGERLYRTGDLGAWRPDGTLDFLGRMDFQVKIRGHRIEPAEVEDAIKRHEGVEDAVVMAWEPVPQDRRLVAYVVGDVAIDELRQDLRERLPDYMVPASFVTLAALPLALNGKVDRKALPPPGQQSSETSHVPPLTHVEKIVAGIWAELLGLERVGATDDFFDLGGHSLLAVRLMARIEQFFGVKLPLATLFEAPTVRDLAAAIEGDPVWRSTLVRLHPGGSGRPLFLIHAAGGDVFSYVELAKKLGAERPVYGLQAVAEGDAPQPTLEDLAARYLAAVREVQPEGPWRLAGWSGGAVIAYEMARQAGSTGDSTSFLALFDPPPPPTGRGLDVTSLLAGFAALGGIHSKQKLEAVREGLEGLDLEPGLDRVMELARAEGLLPPGVDKSWMRERYELYSRTVIAVESYVPGPYEGQMVLFRASASLPPGATDLTAGWGLLARTEAHLIPDTNHFSLLQMPALDRVVELLGPAL